MMTTCKAASESVTHIGVGIDTARYGHRVTFLRDDRQPAAPAMTVTENQQGFQQLKRQLQQLHRKHPDAHFHLHLDAAGQYATNLERFLRSLSLPITLSVGEPKRNKDYHKAFSPKRTTDDTESHAMARFGVVEQPQPTPPVPDEFFALREIASRLQAQIRDTTRAINRLHNVLARVFPELATLVSNLAVACVALGHCMRKLLHQVFGVWASNTPFDEKRAQSRHLSEAPSTTQTSNAPGVQNETETAAGHKRDVLPKRKVVTAANTSVAPSTALVNQADETPGLIDYAHLREQITMEQILLHLGYLDHLRGRGQQRRGPCPLHGSLDKRKRDFSVNLSKNVFRCLHSECGHGGNVLDFWAALQGLPLYQAALHLAATFHLQIQPEQRRGTRNMNRKPR